MERAADGRARAGRETVAWGRARRRGNRRKRGNALGLWFFRVALRLFGLRRTYGLLYIVGLYYVLCDIALVSSVGPYVRRRFPGSGIVKQRLHIYRLLVSQGKQLIDRYASVSGWQRFGIRVEGYDEFASLMRKSGKGAILLTSHQGNWQFAMTAISEVGRTVHLVMVPDDNPELQEALYPRAKGGNVRIISPRQYLGGVVEITNALKRGDVVSMMGDRRYGAPAVEVSFLGDSAWLPYGAFSVAAAMECPVVVLSASKVSMYEYMVDMRNILYPRYGGGVDKVRQLRPWVQEFASLMEAFAAAHPYECFLFRDVWREEGDEAPM